MELTEGGLIRTCRFVIKCCDAYGTLPLSWSPIQRSLQLKKARWKLTLYRSWLIFSCFATSLAILQILVTWEDASMFVRSFSLEYISAFVMTLPSCYVNTHYPEEIVTLINALIRFEERYKNTGFSATMETVRVRSRWWTKWIIKMTALSTFSMIPFQLNAIVQPCFPVYFGYWLSNNCENGKHLGPIPVIGAVLPFKEFLIRFGLCILSFVNWAFLVPGVMMHICLMMLKAHCFRCYVRHITDKLVIIKTKTPKNDGKIEKNWLQLRQVQVMLICFRRIYSRFVLVSIAAGGMFAQVATLYISIDLLRSGNASNQKGMMIACTWVATGMGLIFFFVYGTLGDVYKIAGEQMGRMKSRQVLMKNKWFRKSLRGYPLLGISLGDYSFLEPCTPLNIENLVVDQTVDFLLV